MTPHAAGWGRCHVVLCRIMLDFRHFLKLKRVA